MDGIWWDAEALERRFPELATASVVDRVRMGGGAWHMIVSRWAVANGYAHDLYPRLPDWHALRAAGVIHGQDGP